MKHSHISFNRVNLHYASVAFKERSLKTLLGKICNPRKKTPLINDIHALKDVSLEIAQGERIALLGHNGAGKSTFLKTVAGLYPLSGGTRTVKGKIRSLFDLQLGFEGDATGRENILYRGLFLGLSPAFMRKKEEEIVDFAEIGEFIDYPVRTYSAGMQIRLAFAISTAVEGDILLLDEVISAGDTSFMLKARKRITALIEQSEILILASHDLDSLATLCRRGLVFDHGRLIFDGRIESAINFYHQRNVGSTEMTREKIHAAKGIGR